MMDMKRITIILVALVLGLTSCTKDVLIKYRDAFEVYDTLYVSSTTSTLVSIQQFGVLPTNSASVNKVNLQKAIDWASTTGAALYVTPEENGYPCDGGLTLKKNVSLIGAHGPTGRGTANSSKSGPTGSLFVIKDKSSVFIKCESATQIKGIQFYYPNQTYNDGSKIIEYPATIGMVSNSNVQGVTLMNLTFYGEYIAMDFRATTNICEQILFENCYGYPLSGQFIAIDKCYDIPRVLHCHVNPANQREFGRGFNTSVIDAVCNKKTYTYWFDHVDNLVLMDIFTFGVYGGVYLGPSTYGQLTNFNFDCVNRGIYKSGDGANNRTWMIAQGSIIANVGDVIDNVHPVYVEGTGYTSLISVEAFSGNNSAVTNLRASYDFLYVGGTSDLSVSVTNCRMANYTSASPITRVNKNSNIVCTSCVDKNGDFFEYSVKSEAPVVVSGTKVLDNCDASTGWNSGFNPSTITVDSSTKKEGSGSLSVTGTGTVVFQKQFTVPVNAGVTKAKGHFKMSLYISDISALDLAKDGSIEITSGGTCDKQETAWKTTGLGLKTGWNELDLPISEGGVTGGDTDFQAINYFRFYHTGITSSVTIKIDDLKFVQD